MISLSLALSNIPDPAHPRAAQVDGLCSRFEEELGPCTVVATGGLAGLIAPLTTSIDHHEPWLTLYGLRIIYDRNTHTQP